MENKFFDYRTEPVNGSDVVDLHKTGMSYYDDFLSKNPKTLEWLRDRKNLIGEVVMMTPEEYYQQCSDYGFLNRHPSVDSLKQSRAVDTKTLAHLKDVLTEYGKKFPMPMLNKADPGQEGLHRMMVIGDMFGWDHKVPVLVIDWADKQRAFEEQKRARIEKIEYRIKDAVRDTLRYKFRNIDELREQIQTELDNQFEYDDDISTPVNFELTSNEQTQEFKVTIGAAEYSFDYEDVQFIDDVEDDVESDDIDIGLDDLEDLDDFMVRYFGNNYKETAGDVYNKLKTKLDEDVTKEVDSQGNELSPEQQAFFKQSKVRDKNGNLFVCYHGSGVVFTTFDKNKIRTGNSLGRGFYFSTDAGTSEHYLKQGGEVKQVYLNIKNPKFFTIEADHQAFLVQTALEYKIPAFDKNHRQINLNNYVSELLQSKGYDGVIAYIPAENKYEIVAYEPEQIKSTSNRTPTNKADINEEV